MEPGSGTLTDILNYFLQVLGPGAGRLGPSARNLVGLLATFEVLLLSLWWVHTGEDAIKGLLKKILVVFFFVWVIDNYSTILSWVIEGFKFAGETAAGGLNLDAIERPSAVVEVGYANAYELLQLAVRLGGDWNFFDAMIVLICTFVILFAYYILAIQIFLTRVEFALVSTLALILLPFAVFRPTAFLGEKVFGVTISFGIKFMVLSLIVALAMPLLTALEIPEDPAWGEMFNVMVATLALSVLALHAPGVASALLTGTPSLSGGAIGTAQGIVTGAAAGGALTAGALKSGALKGGGGALRAVRAGTAFSKADTSSSFSLNTSSVNGSFGSEASAPLKAVGNGTFPKKHFENSSEQNGEGTNTNDLSELYYAYRDPYEPETAQVGASGKKNGKSFSSPLKTRRLKRARQANRLTGNGPLDGTQEQLSLLAHKNGRK